MNGMIKEQMKEQRTGGTITSVHIVFYALNKDQHHTVSSDYYYSVNLLANGTN